MQQVRITIVGGHTILGYHRTNPTTHMAASTTSALISHISILRLDTIISPTILCMTIPIGTLIIPRQSIIHTTTIQCTSTIVTWPGCDRALLHTNAWIDPLCTSIGPRLT